MRILIENGSHDMRNLGDIAMLQVAVVRLRELWPGAVIEVLTRRAERLAAYCPDVHPVHSRGRRTWCRRQDAAGSGGEAVGTKAHNLLMSLYDVGLRIAGDREFESFLASLSQADLVVSCGGGYINDSFEEDAIQALTVLGRAARSGKVTAMFGQGIGPIESGKLLAKAAAVLPTVGLLALREKRRGPAILESLGIGADNVMTTGDDAIELAYQLRPAELGAEVGVNLRVAEYSGAQARHIETLQSVLQGVAEKYSASLIPIPILLEGTNRDDDILESLLTGDRNASSDAGKIWATEDVVRKVGRCRVVVTGSYHGAVFALSQGIGVVCLANSSYYADKFLGLSEEFGCGCEVIPLEAEDLGKKLSTGIDTAYESSERIRPRLLEAACRQIALSRKAYRRVYEMVEGETAEPDDDTSD